MKQRGFMPSLGYALAGLRHCLRREANWRRQLTAGLVTLVVGGILHLSPGEWLFVVLGIAGVLAAEALNTAIEKLCDVVCPGPHPDIKVVKDVAAGAVLLVAAGAAVGGLIIFLPKILHIVQKIIS